MTPLRGPTRFTVAGVDRTSPSGSGGSGSRAERRRTPIPRERHLLRGKELADARYADPIGVVDMAAAAGLSVAHFSRTFSDAFGETPRQYLLTRRLERAASLLRNTDRSVTEICFMVGLESLGSFTTSFGRMYGMTPTEYRGAHPPASALARIPACIARARTRPENRTFREDPAPRRS